MLALGFQHMGSFRCAASACPITCCSGWNVEMDDETLKYYRSVGGEFGKLLNKTLDEYLVMKENGPYLNLKGRNCPLLTERGLCSVQLTLGAEHLGIACATYPRTLMQFGDLQIAYMSASCPEYARMLLLAPESLDVELIDEDRNEDLTAFSFLEYEGALNPDSVSKEALLICISIAQNRMFSIVQRQRLLLIFNRMLQDALDAEEYEKCLDIFLLFADPSAYTQFVMEEEKSFHMVEKVAFIRKLDMWKNAETKEKELHRDLWDMLRQFEAMDMDKMLRLHGWLEDMNHSHAAQLENILTYLLVRHYLETENHALFRQTVCAIALTQIYRILAASALLRSDGQFPDEERVLLLSRVSKDLEHREGFLEKLYNMAREGDMDGLPFLYRLIS